VIDALDNAMTRAQRLELVHVRKWVLWVHA
jgi:hypothetical protein